MRSLYTLRRRAVVASALGTCLLAWAGCGSSNLSGPTGTVIGKVTLDGKPAPAGTTVVFVNQDNAMAAVGQVAADGSYTLLMRGERKVLTGPYRVSISPPQVTVDMNADAEAYRAIMTGEAKPPQPAGNFPEKYKSAETSGVTFIVQAGSNICDVEMKDE